jgi:hypothetical protein
MTQDTIIGYKGLEIRHKESADEEILALLGRTVLGTEGGLRYSVRNFTERMKFYGIGLSFIGLYKKNNLAGVIGLCERKTTTLGKEYSSTFLRYLSVRSSFQIARVKDNRMEKLIRAEDTFKQQIFSMFSNPSGLPGGRKDPSEPHIIYACVEGENERSKNFVRQAGYEHISSLRTIAFSRFKPRANPSVTRLSPEEEPAMAELLSEHYREYCFYTGQFSFLNHQYYVLKKDDRIVAGVSALPTTFNIIDFPGIQGWVLLKVLPYMPLFKKIFKPHEFRFLIFDSIYCRDGNDHLLADLFEAVCAAEGYHSAITWVDEKSALFRSLKAKVRMGVLNKILTTSPGFVYASFSNISPEDQKKFYDCPAYLSGVDFA